MNRAADAIADFLPFARSGEALPPPRIRAVLEGCYQQFWSLLDSALARGFDEHEAELFRQAERARNSNEQHRLLEALREVRKRRPDFLRACRDGVQRALLRLVDPRVVADDLHADTSASSARLSLSLADPDKLEEELLLRSLAARAEMRASGELQALAYRLALVTQDVPSEIDQIAIGPHAVYATLLVASRRLDLPVADRIALLRRIDKLLYGDAGSLYAHVNGWLAEHRVLPNLNLKPRLRVARGESAQGGARPHPAPEVTAPNPTGAEGGSRPVEAAAPPVPAAAKEAPEPGRTAASPPADRVPASTTTASGDDTDYSFDMLRSLLAARRPPDEAASGAPLVPAPRQAVESALREMQGAQARRPSGATPDARRPMADIKRELVSRLPAAQGGAPARLSDEDSDAVDLVGFLFDQLLADYRPDNPGHGLLDRLQLPLLKVALNDKGFFTQRHHPARRLLNSLAEATVFWLDGSPQDQAVIEKMDWIVDRANRDYKDDVSAFRDLFDDLSKHLSDLSRKAEVAERRHVEAAKGREKLDVARSTAAELVAERLARSEEPPLAVRRLLERPWTDVLALSILRHGPEHTVTRNHVEFVDRLIDLFAPGRPLAEQRAESRELRRQLEEGLGTIGIHEDAISEAWAEVHRITEDARPESSAAAAESVAQLIAVQPRLGTSTTPPAPAESAVEAEVATPAGPAESGTSLLPQRKGLLALPMTPREQAAADELKKVPFGTWFEFTVNQQGDKAMRKLCWLSPVTGRCLFVNARGGRAQERHVRDVAWEIARGTCRQVEPARESLVDRAWKSIVSLLRGGEAATPRAEGAHAP